MCSYVYVYHQCTVPIIPRVINETNDTSNFEAYPDSDEEAPMPVYGDGADPFAGF